MCLPPSVPPRGRSWRIRTRPPRRSRGRAGTPTERNAAGGGRRRRGRPLRIVRGYLVLHLHQEVPLLARAELDGALPEIGGGQGAVLADGLAVHVEPTLLRQ